MAERIEIKCIVCGDPGPLINKWHCSKECARIGYLRWSINDISKSMEAITISLCNIQNTLNKLVQATNG